MKKRKTWRRVGINGKKKNKLMVEKSRLDLWAELDVMGRVDTETKKGPNFDVDDEENGARVRAHGEVRSACISLNRGFKSALNKSVPNGARRAKSVGCGISGEGKDHDDDN